MNLNNLNSSLPKPWLNIHANSVESKKVDLVNQNSVLNPPVGSITIFSDLNGILNSTNSLGTSVSYTTSAQFNDALLSVGGVVEQNNIPSYANTTGLLVQDSGVNSSDIFLRTGVVPMIGNLSLGGFNLTNAGIITTNTDTVNVGNANTISSAGDIYVGSHNTAGGSSGGISVIYGNTNNMSGSANGQSIVYGNNNRDSNAAGGSFIFGFGNTNGTGQRNVLIGRNNIVPNGINEAYTIGFALTNSISNSLLVGGNIVNIRPNNTNICNLGVLTTNQFNNTFTNNVDTSSALSIAPITATSLALGRAGILSTINGNCAINSQAFGAWYSTVSFNNGFAAGVDRVINPASTTSGSLSQFTNTLGILTYTGTRTRLFKVEYNISYLIPATTGNMTFFNSINPATPPVLGIAQTRIFYQSTGPNGGTRACVHFSDNITMATNDTIQLSAQLQNLNVAVTFDFIMCNIVGALN